VLYTSQNRKLDGILLPLNSFAQEMFLVLSTFEFVQAFAITNRSDSRAVGIGGGLERNLDYNVELYSKRTWRFDTNVNVKN
jgi:hypothetical protein